MSETTLSFTLQNNTHAGNFVKPEFHSSIFTEAAPLDSSKKSASEASQREKKEPKTVEHSPKTATILALALPGSGQIYNRKYWKVPVVYGAMGYTTYRMLQNRSKMRTLNDSIRGLFVAGKSPSAQLIAERDKFRGNRDISILMMAGIYVLQAVDATVDAHFYKFNINDDITLSAQPNPTAFLALNWQLR